MTGHELGREWHRCLCVTMPPGGRVASWCRASAPPDAPFCLDCEPRHPGYPDSWTVTVAASLARGWDL